MNRKLMASMALSCALSGCADEATTKAIWLCKRDQVNEPVLAVFHGTHDPASYVASEDLDFLRARDGDDFPLPITEELERAVPWFADAMAHHTTCTVLEKTTRDDGSVTLELERDAPDLTDRSFLALGLQALSISNAQDARAKVDDWVDQAEGKRQTKRVTLTLVPRGDIMVASYQLQAQADALVREAERKRLDAEITRMEERVAEAHDADGVLSKLHVTGAIFKHAVVFSVVEPRVALTLGNDTGRTISKVTFSVRPKGAPESDARTMLVELTEPLAHGASRTVEVYPPPKTRLDLARVPQDTHLDAQVVELRHKSFESRVSRPWVLEGDTTVYLSAEVLEVELARLRAARAKVSD